MSRTSSLTHSRGSRGLFRLLLIAEAIETYVQQRLRCSIRQGTGAAKTLAVGLSLVLFLALTESASAQELFRGGVGEKAIVVARLRRA